MTDFRALLAEADEWLEHTSWRCEHAPHFYLANDRGAEIAEAGDCFCGLLAFQARVTAALETA